MESSQPTSLFPRSFVGPYQEPRVVRAQTIHHYTIFPLILGQILREHAMPEFHLTIYSGKWDYGRLGHPGEPGVESGAELWAWMSDGAQASIDERWKSLQNSLSGLFCASLGRMDTFHTTSPTRDYPLYISAPYATPRSQPSESPART
ncbi:Gpi16 subunit, GPI transamidase component-domain-containing protein [Lactifluus volemus]|nr:Gpi16 subunit, GPI transamidase component-domain-containing protein [Lactifluus volemus]